MFHHYARSVVLLLMLMILAGCNAASEENLGQPSDPPAPPATSAPVAPVEPTATTVPPNATETAVPATGSAPSISLDTGSIATGFQTETIAALPAGSDAPYWELLPEYTVATLQGYPISNHLMRPQIFVYPLQELQDVNEGAGQIVASLQTLIASPQEIPNMPFLPLFNASQVMHAQVQYLDFLNGQGLRYVTEFDQAFIPINNYELIYTYQGLTGDGKYYVAAVLPITHPSLPADANVTGNEPPEFTSNFPTYLANVTSDLNTQASNTYSPDLTQLDAMMSSLEIK